MALEHKHLSNGGGLVDRPLEYRVESNGSVKRASNVPLMSYALARIDELLDQLNDSVKFFKFHMGSDYWRMLVAPTDVYKTAFSTPFGLFEWLLLPFGLTGAPAFFSR